MRHSMNEVDWIEKGQKRLKETAKALEELFFEQQAKSEASLNKKDEIFSYFVNESNSFCKITNKIANEFGCQTISLKKKIDGFFLNLAENLNSKYARSEWQKESQE